LTIDNKSVNQAYGTLTHTGNALLPKITPVRLEPILQIPMLRARAYLTVSKPLALNSEYISILDWIRTTKRKTPKKQNGAGALPLPAMSIPLQAFSTLLLILRISPQPVSLALVIVSLYLIQIRYLPTMPSVCSSLLRPFTVHEPAFLLS